MATETVVLDKIDKQILSILQTDGRISWHMLGDRVHLSANAVAERVRRMTRAGVIRGFKAEVNQAALGRTLEAVIDARMPHTQGFDDAVMKRDDVLWAASRNGRIRYHAGSGLRWNGRARLAIALVATRRCHRNPNRRGVAQDPLTQPPFDLAVSPVEC
jgi:DNA-binding Lrp family transcriptional regulator